MCTVHSVTWPVGHLATPVRGAGGGVRGAVGELDYLSGTYALACRQMHSLDLSPPSPLHPSRWHVGRARATGTDNLIKRETTRKDAV